MKTASNPRIPGFTAESSIYETGDAFRVRFRIETPTGIQPAYGAFECMEDCRRMGLSGAFADCACLGRCK